MKVLRIRMYRILSAVTACLIICFSFLSSAINVSADSSLSYQDYITDSELSGDRKYVTCTFPYTLNHVDYMDRNESGFYGDSVGQRYVSLNMSDLALNPHGQLDIDYEIYPIGNSYLYLDDLPLDTKFEFSYYLRFGTAFWDILYVDSRLYVTFYDSEHRLISDFEVFNKFYRDDNQIRVDGTFNPVQLGVTGDVSYVKFHVYIHMAANVPSDFSTTVQLQVNDFFLTFPLDGLAVIIEQNQQLINSNQAIKDALDQIQTGSSDQQAAAGQFNSEVDQVVGELNQIGDQLNEVPRETFSVSDLVPTDILQGTHFLTYVDALNNFWDSPEIALIVVTLGGMILISYLLFGEKG